jgi:pimeloyl-ACP methyl ester carboxylesterase
MHVEKNILVPGPYGRPLLTDVFYEANNRTKPVVIFCHGYKGFKDWGAWNQMAEYFVKHDICFIKFNFSHNGGTSNEPIDFPDLEAFALNNYSKELSDLQTIIDWVCNEFNENSNIDPSNITLIGHSRGGGIVTIKAEEDKRIKRVISLAGVSDFKNRFLEGSDEFKNWQSTGVKYVLNGRTKQKMPHYFQFYEDFVLNETRLTIKRAAKELEVPHLIIHGNADSSVSVEEAHHLHLWNPESSLVVIDGADHVFNTKHPWEEAHLSDALKTVVNSCIQYIQPQTV